MQSSSMVQPQAASNGKLSDQFWRMAERFVQFFYREAGFRTIVCNEHGVITVAHDKTRIGKVHAGAVSILKGDADDYAVTAEAAAQDANVKEGFNTPIYIDGRRVGTFGLAASLAIAKPVARLGAIILASWITQLRQQELLQQTAHDVSVKLGELNEKITGAGQTFRQVRERMQETSRYAADKVDNTGQILRTIHQIAQQTHILSLNGSVEAARAGEQGRAFTVVVEEMARLAANTRAATGRIEEGVSDISKALADVQAAMEQSSQLFQSNIEMLQSVAPLVSLLQTSINQLEASFRDTMT
jgi:uncharacterized protein YukE